MEKRIGRIVKCAKSDDNANKRTLPVIGKISIGKKSINKNGKEYPTALDYFYCNPDNGINKYHKLFSDAYPGKPNTITIAFHSDDPRECCYERYEFRDKKTGRLIADGDGESWRIFNDQIGDYDNDIQTSLEELKAKLGIEPIIRLTIRFLLPNIKGVLGVWEINTRGYKSSIQNIINVVDSVISITNSIVFVPFDLSVTMAKSDKPGDTRKYPVLTLVPNISQNRLESLVRIYDSLPKAQILVSGLLTDSEIEKLEEKTVLGNVLSKDNHLPLLENNSSKESDLHKKILEAVEYCKERGISEEKLIKYFSKDIKDLSLDDLSKLRNDFNRIKKNELSLEELFN